MLHDLPPELLLLVLQASDCPTDLHSFISASSDCYRVFRLNSKRILSSILTNAIPPMALPHAIAIINAPTEFSGSNDAIRAKAFLSPFINDYFENCCSWTRLPTDYDSIKRLSRLYSKIERFIYNYQARSLAALKGCSHSVPYLPSWASDGSNTPISPLISVTERGRLQRAFFRYELYCHVFPRCYSWRHEQIFDKDEQLELFIDELWVKWITRLLIKL